MKYIVAIETEQMCYEWWPCPCLPSALQLLSTLAASCAARNDGVKRAITIYVGGR